MSMPVAFLLRSTMDTTCRIKNGLQAGLGNLHATRLALTVAAVLDPLQRPINLFDGVFLAPQQTQGEFLIEIVAAKFCHVGRHTRGFAAVLVQGVTNSPEGIGYKLLQGMLESHSSLTAILSAEQSSIIKSAPLSRWAGIDSGANLWTIRQE